MGLYNEEIYSKSNINNRNFLDDYVLELKSRGLSEGTIKQYQNDLRGYICWIYNNQNDMFLLDLKRRDFRNFILYLQEMELSNARINRFQSSIRNALEYALLDDDDYPEYIQNPMARIKSLDSKAVVKEVVFLEDEQVTFLLNYLLKSKQYQKALYLSLSYDSCGRRSEIYSVTKDGFLTDGVYKTLPVKGKGGKVFPLHYSDRTKQIAKLYLDDRGSDNIDSLWINERGKEKRQVSKNMLYLHAISLRSILEAEYNKDIPMSSHSIRHFGLQNYQDGTHSALKFMGKDKLELDMLKILAHHTNISTTEGYLKDNSSDLLDDLFKG